MTASSPELPSALGGRVTLDRGTIGILDDGDQVTVGMGESGATGTLTFHTTNSTTVAAGDAGVAYQTISTGLGAALASNFTDVTIEVAKALTPTPCRSPTRR
jgi:hypothetical protein